MKTIDYKQKLTDHFFKIVKSDGLIDELKAYDPDIDIHSAVRGYYFALGKIEKFIENKI